MTIEKIVNTMKKSRFLVKDTDRMEIPRILTKQKTRIYYLNKNTREQEQYFTTKNKRGRTRITAQ